MNQPIEQLLSRNKSVNVNMPLDSAAGISSDAENIRILLSSGGDLELVIKKNIFDANGEMIGPDDKLYREKESGSYLTAKSVFRCLGCNAYFNLSSGHEVKKAVSIITDNPNDQVNPSGVFALQLPSGDEPSSGYCPQCWKLECRTRLWSAILNFFLKPLKTMVTQPEETVAEQESPLLLMTVARQSLGRSNSCGVRRDGYRQIRNNRGDLR